MSNSGPGDKVRGFVTENTIRDPLPEDRMPTGVTEAQLFYEWQHLCAGVVSDNCYLDRSELSPSVVNIHYDKPESLRAVSA